MKNTSSFKILHCDNAARIVAHCDRITIERANVDALGAPRWEHTHNTAAGDNLTVGQARIVLAAVWPSCSTAPTCLGERPGNPTRRLSIVNNVLRLESQYVDAIGVPSWSHVEDEDVSADRGLGLYLDNKITSLLTHLACRALGLAP